jgi:hypothetical protein
MSVIFSTTPLGDEAKHATLSADSSAVLIEPRKSVGISARNSGTRQGLMKRSQRNRSFPVSSYGFCDPGWLAAIFFLMIYATTAIDASARSAKQLETALTGKFVAQVAGPRLTGFGLNHESYIFEMYSPVGSQFVTLSYTFLIYQPQLPGRALDYSKLYKLTAVRDDTCDATLGKISKRFIFDSDGGFVGTEYALVYASNLPSLMLPWTNSLPCYVLSPKELSLATVP